MTEDSLDFEIRIISEEAPRLDACLILLPEILIKFLNGYGVGMWLADGLARLL